MEDFVKDAQHAKFVFWLLTGALSMIGVLAVIIGNLWRKNQTLEKESWETAVATIKESIDTLSETIKESTTKFEHTAERIWSYIGEHDIMISWLIGQHEANHKVKAPDRKLRVEIKNPR